MAIGIRLRIQPTHGQWYVYDHGSSTRHRGDRQWYDQEQYHAQTDQTTKPCFLAPKSQTRKPETAGLERE